MTSKSTRPLRAILGRSALLFLAVLFGSSAVFRVLGTDGTVVAQQLPPAAGLGGEQDVPFLNRDTCTIEPGIAELLDRIAEQRRENRAKEEDLEYRQATLEILKEEIAYDLKILEESQQRLEETLALAEGAVEADLGQLTEVYESMKPKEAAALFATMDPVFAAGFLGRMNAATAANILAGLEPNTAYAISLVLSGRNAEPIVNQ